MNNNCKRYKNIKMYNKYIISVIIFLSYYLVALFFGKKIVCFIIQHKLILLKIFFLKNMG